MAATMIFKYPVSQCVGSSKRNFTGGIRQPEILKILERSDQSPRIKLTLPLLRAACTSSLFTVEPRLSTTPFKLPPCYYNLILLTQEQKSLSLLNNFIDPVNATTLLLRPGFYGPMVVALTGFYCTQVCQCWQSHYNSTWSPTVYEWCMGSFMSHSKLFKVPECWSSQGLNQWPALLSRPVLIQLS